MAADIIAGTQQTISLLNVGEGANVYTLNVMDDRYSINEIVEALCDRDEEVRTAILETPKHWARRDLMSNSAALSHGDALPEHVGEPGEVTIQRSSGASYLRPRGVKSPSEIERLRANTGASPFDVYGSLAHDAANSPLSGFYDLSDDKVIRFTGASAKVRLGTVARLLRTVYDGAISSSGVTLTSTTAAFTSSDVGSIAIIEDARGAGVPLAAMISAFGGATSVTLSAAATATVTGKRLTIARLASPAAYLSAVVRGARGSLWKEGDDPEKGPAHARAFQADLVAVRSNAQSLPDQLREAA